MVTDSFNYGVELPAPLRAYQWQGVRFLIERDSALLADDMGLGKTVQVSVALSLLFTNQEVNRALIIVPASLRLNWQRELRRWAPNLSSRRVQGNAAERTAHYRLPFNVLVASYDQVRLDAQTINSEVTFDVVVLDEAQKIKNPASKTAIACRTLQRRRSWALSGTPLENKTEDLAAVYRFVRPGLVHSGLSRTETHTRMQPYFLRRVKTEVYDQLPPIVIQDIPLEMNKRQRREYDKVWVDRFTAPDGHLLALLTRLKQVCNYDPNSGDSCKLDTLQLILEGYTGPMDKVIVVSQYVESLRWIQAHLGVPTPAEIFHGGLSEIERDRVLDRFRQEPGPRILLLSLTAGATGLNLQEAGAVVFFDRWWNPATENQALHRAYRFGREKPLHVFRFVVVDSIEERIQDVLRDKTQLFTQYIEDADSAAVAPLSRNDLRRILGLDGSETH